MSVFALELGWTAAPRRPPSSSTRVDVLSVAAPYKAPEPTTLGVAPIRRAADNIKLWTGFSDRSLAKAVGVTHPTVRALISGVRPSFVNSADAARRLLMLEQIAGRLRAIAPDTSSLAAALQVPPPGAARSALDEIARGDRGAAYLASLDVLVPRAPRGLLQPLLPMVPGATVSLDDDR